MRIAAAQCLAIPDDFERASDVIAERLAWADAEAVDLILFPEAFVLGHSYDPETIRRRAQHVSAHLLSALCERLAGFRTTLVVGAFELRQSLVFNSAFVIENGCRIGQYSKAYPNEPCVVAGVEFPIFARSGISYGINICNDANHADAANHISTQGAAMILYPLNNMLPPQTAERWREKSIANLVARARQTSCWIVSADVIGSVGGYISHGCTAIVRPDGRVVARVPEMTEGVAVYDLPEMAVP